MISFVPNTIQDAVYRQQEADRKCHLLLSDPRRRHDFTQSLVFTGRNSQLEDRESFLHSVHIVPTLGGDYKIYRSPRSITPILENEEIAQRSSRDDALLRSIEVSSKSYGHNIGNPDLWQMRFREKTSLLQSYPGRGSSGSHISHRTGTFDITSLPGNMKRKKLQSSYDDTYLQKQQREEPKCHCKTYHCHTFPNIQTTQALQRLLSFSESQTAKSHDIVAYNVNHHNIANTFWRPNLSMEMYTHGDPLVSFHSLWPKDIKSLLQDGMNNTALRDAISDLSRLTLTCGPNKLLHCLIELFLIRVDHQFEGGSGLLHLACLAHNSEAVQYLIHIGVSPSLKDKHGRTAEEVCFDPAIKKQLPVKHQLFRDRKEARMQSQNPSMKDKDEIFRLAENPRYLEELQLKLQSLNFNVNTECNTDGDFVLHIASRKGLCQLPLITGLVKVQKADIELCNSQGMSALMIAAEEGDTILCDVLICLFGANPNRVSVQDGKSALHYAVEGNHINTINCLIRRGADVNIEDDHGCRPDDIPFLNTSIEDCREIINLHRDQRIRCLCDKTRQNLIKREEIRETDMYVVDEDGYTLHMLAAKHNRVENLQLFLQVSIKSINAQYKDGKTALSMAAEEGHIEAVRWLLQNGANPAIMDMCGNLPLHYAVLSSHKETVEVFLDFFPTTYKGLFKALRLCKRTPIYTKVKEAWERRQEEIVTPDLLGCAMEGKAEELYCLLEDGDSINSKSGVGNWPMYLAVENGHIDVIKLLHKKGADIKKRHQPTGSTVLHIAAKMGHLDIVQYLLQFCHESTSMSGTKSKIKSKHKSLDVNAVNSERKTALQLAAEKGFIKIVKLLIQQGATTALLNSNGMLITCPEFVGVRAEIESHREHHMQMIMKLITDKTKKSTQALVHSWVKKFDHHLRDRNGDTPLMVACKRGKPEVVRFLLDSAVYRELTEEDSSDNLSDADSGILDIVTGKLYSKKDEMLKSLDISSEFCQGADRGLTSSVDFTKTMQQDEDLKSVVIQRDTDSRSQQLSALLNDVEKPKGLYIYHDGVVSHVCAVNSCDGCTPLHRVLEGGDNPQVVLMILRTDASCVNMQNIEGLTPLHLACKLNRKKSLEKLLTVEGIDLNLLTLDAQLPEEMTTNRAVMKMTQKARKGHPVRPKPGRQPSVEPSLSIPDTSSLSVGGSTINFEKVQHRYEALRHENQEEAIASTSQFEHKLK